MTKTSKTNYRSLLELAAAIHAVERKSIFEIGALLLEAKAGHPGEFLAWRADEFKDAFSTNTAERWMNAERLRQKFPKIGELKVTKTTHYALCDLEENELPPVIARLAKESNKRWLRATEAARFIRIEQARLKYGGHPDATLNALMGFSSEDVIEALLASNPETDEAAQKIADEVMRKAEAEAERKAQAEAEAERKAQAEQQAQAKRDDPEASAAERKREYADVEATAAGDAFTRAAADAFARAATAAGNQNTTEPDDKPFPDMPVTNVKTIGEVQEYIAEALRRGVSRDAKLYIQDENEDLEHPEVYFIDDDGPDAPPFMVVVAAKENANDDADKSDITTSTKVERKVFSKALKKAGHDLRKVKLS
jgi:hypothetical protein